MMFHAVAELQGTPSERGIASLSDPQPHISQTESIKCLLNHATAPTQSTATLFTRLRYYNYLSSKLGLWYDLT